MIDLLDLIAIVLVVIPVTDWITVILLTHAGGLAMARSGHVPRYLAERRRAAALIAASATLGGILGLTRLIHEPLPRELGLLILVAILVLPSIANLLWLWQALRGDFGRTA